MFYRGFLVFSSEDPNLSGFELLAISNCYTDVLSQPPIMKKFLLHFSILVLLLSFSVASATAQNPRTKATKLIVKGDNYMANGEWQNAILTYTNAIYADEGYAMSYMKRAKALMRTGQETEGQRDYNKAISLNPYIEFVYDDRAKLELLDRRIGWDEEHLNLFLRLNKYDEMVVYYDFEETTDTVDFEKRVGTLEDRIQEQPEDSLAYLEQSLLLYNNRDLVAANQVIDDVLERFPTMDQAWQVKGMIQYRQYDAEGAISSFNRAIELNPLSSWGKFERAMSYAALQNYDRAIKDMNEFFRLNDTLPLAYHARGHFHIAQGDIDKGIADFTRAIELDSTDEMSYIHRGQAYELKDDLFDAHSDYRKASEMNANNPIAFKLRANMELMRGQMQEARFHYDRAIELDQEYAAAYYNRGLARIMTYRGAEGCEDLREALRLGYVKVEKMIPYFCNAYENR